MLHFVLNCLPYSAQQMLPTKHGSLLQPLPAHQRAERDILLVSSMLCPILRGSQYKCFCCSPNTGEALKAFSRCPYHILRPKCSCLRCIARHSRGSRGSHLAAAATACRKQRLVQV
jgi:hypothetical protein